MSRIDFLQQVLLSLEETRDLGLESPNEDYKRGWLKGLKEFSRVLAKRFEEFEDIKKDMRM